MTAPADEFGYWYEHTNGEVIFKPRAVVNFTGPETYFEGPFVVRWWGGRRNDPRKPEEVNPDAPVCPQCRFAARLSTGSEVYAHRRDLADKPIWVCDPCGAYCGCHPDTTKPLGTPAGAALRKARMALHEQRLDPLWKTAHLLSCYGHPTDEKAVTTIQRAARRRVYAYLAHHMGLAEFHTGELDIEGCRRAWEILTAAGDYTAIRDWAAARKAENVKQAGECQAGQKSDETTAKTEVA